MKDRHSRLRGEVYSLIPFTILWICIGIFIIVNAITRGAPLFFSIVLIVIFLFITFLLFRRRIRSFLLDFKEQPTEVDGFLSFKRRHRRTSPQYGTSYYLCIDTLGFDVKCSREEWDMVDKGDKIHASYHRHSKVVESIDVLKKSEYKYMPHLSKSD